MATGTKDAEGDGYTWESQYEKTWEALTEDDDGSLQRSVADVLAAQKRKRLLDRKTNVRLGLMRHLYVIVDMSEAMAEKDLAPDRRIVTLNHLDKFVEAFFDENPISQLGFITTSDKRALRLSPLSGSGRRHKEALATLRKAPCVGEPSLQNALDLAHRALKLLPGHTSREILVVMGSLSSCDPSNISATIAMLSAASIRVSVIGLAAEVYLCKRLAAETGGLYSVILDAAHLGDLLASHTQPAPAQKDADSNLVRMGFPEHRLTRDEPSMCTCHSRFTGDGFFCPQCGAKYCALPVECRLCGLTLVTGAQLARSYQHLFPFKAFAEAKIPDGETRMCRGCRASVTRSAYACGECGGSFCGDCDLLIHESLQTCPGCAS